MCCCTGNSALALGFGSEAAGVSGFAYDIDTEQGQLFPSPLPSFLLYLGLAEFSLQTPCCGYQKGSMLLNPACLLGAFPAGTWWARWAHFHPHGRVECKPSPGIKKNTLFLIVLLGGDSMARKTLMEMFSIWKILNLEILLPLQGVLCPSFILLVHFSD